MLNPTQEVLAQPPKQTERPPSPAGRRITLVHIGRIVAIASGIAVVVGIGATCVFYYRAGLGQLRALGAIMIIWSISMLAVIGAVIYIARKRAERSSSINRRS